MRGRWGIGVRVWGDAASDATTTTGSTGPVVEAVTMSSVPSGPVDEVEWRRRLSLGADEAG